MGLILKTGTAVRVRKNTHRNTGTPESLDLRLIPVRRLSNQSAVALLKAARLVSGTRASKFCRSVQKSILEPHRLVKKEKKPLVAA